MAYKLEKPCTKEQRIKFIVEYNHKLGLKIEETDSAFYALEQNEINRTVDDTIERSSTSRKNTNEIISILSDLNVNNLTPLNAFDVLVQLKNYLKD